MKSTFPVKSQRNLGAKVNLFSMEKFAREVFHLGVFTIPINYLSYYQRF